MRLMGLLRRTPLWLLLPACLVVGSAAFAVSGYEPLVFDPSLYEVQTANADELGSIDAAALEAQGTQPADAGELATVGNEGLVDGSWTGFAPCGVGNGDGWKPYYVQVGVTVADGKVAALGAIAGSSTGNEGDVPLSWDAAENQRYLDQAANGASGVRAQIEGALAAGSAPASIDAVSGATYSSVSIFNAYADAVAKAGSQPAAPQAQPSQEVGDDKPAKRISGGSEAVGELADGTWKGYMACGVGNTDEWKPYYVEVAVKVDDGKVTKVSKVSGSSTGDAGQKKLDWDAAENQAYLDWAVNGRTLRGRAYEGVVSQIEDALAAGGQPTAIDAVSGATYSSDAVVGAYFQAVAKAAKAAGASSKVPEAPATARPPAPAPQPVPVPDIPVEEGIELIDGTYEGCAFCRDEDDPSQYDPYYILVRIEVSGGKVTRLVSIWGDAEGVVDPAYRYDADDNASYLNRAIKGYGISTKGVQAQIQAKLDAGSAVTGIDTVSQATWSSISIIEAYGNAVESAVQAAKDAAAEAGGEEPEPDPEP